MRMQVPATGAQMGISILLDSMYICPNYQLY